MFLLTAEEAAIFEQLDPATSRRLVIGRTGRAFVWDPTNSTREVPHEAAQSLVKAGIVGPGGRIAAEHLAQWRKPGAAPATVVVTKSETKPAPTKVQMPSLQSVFERTMPMPVPVEALHAA